MTIRLWNTKTKTKEALSPLDPENVRMYVCGPTVYDRAHLGNARPVLVFDVLYRLLKHCNPEAKVTYVRNFTDVDDRINETALKRREAGAEGSLEDLIRERSDETIRWYHEDMDALGALRPDHEPRATKFISQMIDMIQVLIDKEHAYVVRSASNNPPEEYVLLDTQSREPAHTLFDVDSYPEYGQLSGRSTKDMIAGARVEVAPYKRNPMDFVLWKPSTDDLPGWDSPWGRGRPGWHIECSAMAYELLGDTFDIHGGGIDLQFPHHENEIAQSRCAGHGFAKIWMHNEMLQVEGKKMSKSLGNFFTVRDLLKQGVPGEVIRFVMLSTHYRKPMDWTDMKRRKAHIALSNIYSDFEGALHNLHSKKEGFLEKAPEWRREKLPLPHVSVVEPLLEDLNTHAALQAFQDHARVSRKGGPSAEREVLANGVFLGFFGASTIAPAIVATRRGGAVDNVIDKLLSERQTAKAAKNFDWADRIRDHLLAAGVLIKDTPEGPDWSPGIDFDPSRLEDDY